MNPASARTFPPKNDCLRCLRLLLVGCGGDRSKAKVYPVRGEVFFKGELCSGCPRFTSTRSTSAAPPAMATVDDDGAFELTTYSTSDGAAAGDYIVTVNWRDEKPGDGETIVGPDRLGERYSKRDISKLTATVDERRDRGRSLRSERQVASRSSRE